MSYAPSKPVPRAPMITLVGAAGVGKSSLAAMFPNAVFIQAESGESVFDSWEDADKPMLLPELPKSKPDAPVSTKAEIMAQLRWLATDKNHGFKTLVIDTVSALHILFERELCDSEGATNIIEAHGGYGKGLLALRDWHNDVRNACEYLAKKCGIAVIFLSHIGIQKFKQGPSSDEYCIYNLDLPPACLPVYVNLVDAVLFLTQEEFVDGNKTDKKGIITKYGKLIQTGDRYLVTENAGNVGYATAKNRYELDSRILVPHGTNPLLNSIKFFSKGNK
jgi:hypothetical protein